MTFCKLFIEVDCLFMHTSRIFHFTISWCAYEILRNCHSILQRTSGNNWIYSCHYERYLLPCMRIRVSSFSYLLTKVAYFNKKVGKSIRIKLKDLNFIAVFDMIFIYRGPRYTILISRTYSKYTIYMSEKQISNENV